MDKEYNYHAEQLANVKPGKAGDYAATFQIRNGEERTKWMDLHDKSANELVKWLCEYYTPELLTERNTLASLLEAGDGLWIAQVAKEAQKVAFLQIELQAQKDANAELLKERDELKEQLQYNQGLYKVACDGRRQAKSLNAELLKALKMLTEASVTVSKQYDGEDYIGDLCLNIEFAQKAIAKAERGEHANS